MTWPEGSVAVVAHDAGAARLLFSWLEPLHHQLRFYVEGPAKRMLEAERPEIAIAVDLSSCLSGSKLLLSGTSWASSLEHQARVIARNTCVPAIGILDHWVNYHERFWWEGELVLPEALWVADCEAFDLVKAQFPEVPVQKLPNFWLDKLVGEVNSYKRRICKKPRGVIDLLYFLEPLRDRKSGVLTQKEFLSLDYWLKVIPDLVETGHLAEGSQAFRLTLRLHPSEPRGKYDHWISRNLRDWNIQIDSNVSLAMSLAECDAAFGCETQALVAAAACGIPAFSTILSADMPCRLPHKEIKVVNELI